MKKDKLNIPDGQRVFVERQSLLRGFMLAFDGTATMLNDRIVVVTGVSGQVSFRVTEINEMRLEKSTGKLWIYLG